MFKATFCSSILLISGLAVGQVPPNRVQHGTFDELAAGTAPDCAAPAGSWWWPPEYISDGICEAGAQEFRIVPSSTFNAGEPGNSLALTSTLGEPQLVSIFSRIDERPGFITVAEFDIWVAAGAPGGGVVYLSGGTHWADRRAGQIGWRGSTISRPFQFCPAGLMTPYPVDTWQHVRLVIDLASASQSYDVWWSPRGGTPTRIGVALPFGTVSAGVRVSFLDRFTRANFAGAGSACAPPLAADAYLDNVVVYESPDCNANRLPDWEDIALGRSHDVNLNGVPDECDPFCYSNCDGSVVAPVLTANDFQCFFDKYVAGHSYANCDGSTGSPLLTANDFQCFINAFAAGCS